MEKTFGLLFTAILLSFSSMAQDDYDDRITKPRINIGISMGNYGNFDNNVSLSKESNTPSFIVQIEKDWINNFNIGTYLSYGSQKHEYSGEIREVIHNFYRVGTVLSYDLDEWLKNMDLHPGIGWDVYTGLKAGFTLKYRKVENVVIDSQGNPRTLSDSDAELFPDIGIFVGVRYYLHNNFALFSELGRANAGFFTLGINFPF